KATRSAELLFRNAIKRVIALEDKVDLPSELGFVKESRKPCAQDIMLLNDNFMYTQFWRWSKSDDTTLSELCSRIIGRNLLKAIEIPPEKRMFGWEKRKELEEIAQKNHIEADYFCPSDSPVDLPYQPYAPKNPDDQTN